MMEEEFYMKKFVMVGGVDPNTTLEAIDKEIIRITEKSSPRILFIPTASEDDINYCERYKDIYQGEFGCEIDFLYLIRESLNENEIRDKVFKSDIIYIGGGSVAILMKYFNKFNMRDILTEAAEKGIVIAGISAGAICLGQYYFYTEHSDEFTKSEKYVKIDCMGLFKFIIFPHYNLRDEYDKINALIKEYEFIGIGLDNNCALEIINDTYRIITSREQAEAYILYLEDRHLSIEVIKENSKVGVMLQDSGFIRDVNYEVDYE